MRIIYLHGFASGPGSAKAHYFRKKFAERGVSLEVPDLAEGDFENLTIGRQLSVIERTAGDAPVILIGSSLGGYLAALYAAGHPEVLRLVLLAPGFYFPQRWPESLGEEKLQEWRRNGTTEVFHYADRRTRKLGYQIVDEAIQYDPSPSFAQPALLIHGTRDKVVPVGRSEDFARAHGNVQLRLVGSGHELTDVLDLIWEQIEDFLWPQAATLDS